MSSSIPESNSAYAIKQSPRLGAVIFMISDTLIAAEKFANVDVFPGAVWITYAGAQIMMAWGMSRVGPYRDRAVKEKAAATA